MGMDVQDPFKDPLQSAASNSRERRSVPCIQQNLIRYVSITQSTLSHPPKYSSRGVPQLLPRCSPAAPQVFPRFPRESKAQRVESNIPESAKILFRFVMNEDAIEISLTTSNSKISSQAISN